MGLLITLVPKVFVFVGSTTLGTLIEFWFNGLLGCVSKRINH